MHTKRKIPFVLINTLLLYIPLLALTDNQTDRQTNRQIHLLCVGWRNIFPAVLLWQFFGCGGNSFRWYLPTIPVVLLCLFFCCGRKLFLVAQVSFLVVAGKGFRCYFPSYHTSCAVVSVFWLRREIVFGYSVSRKDSYLVFLIERQTARKCVIFTRSNTLLLCVSLLSIYLLYQKDQ
jgi:hypothetical protein